MIKRKDKQWDYDFKTERKNIHEWMLRFNIKGKSPTTEDYGYHMDLNRVNVDNDRNQLNLV